MPIGLVCIFGGQGNPAQSPKMSFQPAIHALTSDGCGELVIIDDSAYSAPDSPSSLVSRNIAVYSPCGTLLTATALNQKLCVSISPETPVRQEYDLSIAQDPTTALSLTSLLSPQGTNIISSPIVLGSGSLVALVATLPAIVQPLLNAAGLTFVTASAQGARLILDARLGSQMGVATASFGAPVVAGTISPSVQARYAAGMSASMSLCGLTTAATLSSTDVVFASATVPIQMAVELTGANLMRRLVASLPPDIASGGCAEVSTSGCPLGCVATISSATPGTSVLPAPLFAYSSPLAQIFSVSETQPSVPNWVPQRQFSYTFPNLSSPAVDLIVSSLLSSGSDIVLVNIQAPNSQPYFSQLDFVATSLAALIPAGTVTRDANVITILAPLNLGAISGSRGGVPYSLLPLVGLVQPDCKDQLPVGMCGDGVYTARVRHVIQEAAYTQAVLDLPSTFSTLNFSIQGPAGFPLLPPIGFPFLAGGIGQFSAYLCSYLNGFFSEALGLGEGQIVASSSDVDPGRIVIMVSLGYLSKIDAAYSVCSGVPNSLTLSGTSLIGGALGPRTQLQFNQAPCTPASERAYDSVYHIPVKCRSVAKLAAVILSEAASKRPAADCWPLSARIAAYLGVFDIAVSADDYATAASAIRSIQDIASIQGCYPCGGSAATPYRPLAPSPLPTPHCKTC